MLPSLSSILRTGAAATATSCIALVVVARAEGRSAAQPFNATSHWLNGDGAARRRSADWRHTGTGLATHAAATVFWAGLFEGLMRRRDAGHVSAQGASVRMQGTLAGTVAAATAVSAVAAAVDYTITPHRFTPGWELMLTKRAMAAVYAAMAAGFALSRPPH